MKKIAILALILAVSALASYRVQAIRSENLRVVNNIVRIQKDLGVPNDFVIAKKSSGILMEPLYIKNGRAFVSVNRADRFSVGQKIHGKDAKITSVSKDIDIDSGMFVIGVSGNLTGNFFVEKTYSGYFLPIDAVLPVGAEIVAKDLERMVVIGLSDGDKVVVR